MKKLTKNGDILDRIRNAHIRIESRLQRIAADITASECAACASVCCGERFCRESVDSDFLRFVLGDKIKEYDNDAGWLRAGKGCALSFGRPLVCYEYFCSTLNKVNNAAGLKLLCKSFGKAYAKIFRNLHILEVQNIREISPGRQEKILVNLELVEQLADDMIKRSGWSSQENIGQSAL